MWGQYILKGGPACTFPKEIKVNIYCNNGVNKLKRVSYGGRITVISVTVYA
jgi:hypothetical protein